MARAASRAPPEWQPPADTGAPGLWAAWQAVTLAAAGVALPPRFGFGERSWGEGSRLRGAGDVGWGALAVAAAYHARARQDDSATPESAAWDKVGPREPRPGGPAASWQHYILPSLPAAGGALLGARACVCGGGGGEGSRQAIAVSRIYRADWPLLVIAPSALRLSWRQATPHTRAGSGPGAGRTGEPGAEGFGTAGSLHTPGVCGGGGGGGGCLHRLLGSRRPRSARRVAPPLSLPELLAPPHRGEGGWENAGSAG